VPKDPALTVKVLTPDDWRLWRRLRLDALREAPYAFGATLAYWQGEGDVEQRWRDRLTAVAFNVAAMVGGEPVGMVSGARTDRTDETELISMWVAPAARGRGVGDRLVAAVVDWSRSLPASRVTLSVVTDNGPAIALYRRHGFKDAGGSPDGPGERLMVCELGCP
jgi:ribosomal protein S18 acetylase RimI-like enzyme